MNGRSDKMTRWEERSPNECARQVMPEEEEQK